MKNKLQDFLLELNNAAKNYYGNRLNKIILYGSYARNEQKPESDVDIMLVLNDEKINPYKEVFDFGHKIYSLGWEYGYLVMIKPTTSNKFFNSKLPFYQMVRKEGIEIQ